LQPHVPKKRRTDSRIMAYLSLLGFTMWHAF
jgi:hypothetical protein